MRKTALIMAGGKGERFWPKSRTRLPKQFLSLTNDGKTMLQLTVERILPLIDLNDIYIATNAAYKALVMEQFPQLPEENILCEPMGRNTAPCIGMGAAHIRKKYGDALMVVLPSDHQIKYSAMFVSTLADACTIAEDGENLVTIGITPNYPETGYGYIKCSLADRDRATGRAFLVEQFVEKPNLEKAKEYLSTEQYLWNSGMFIWKVSSILHNFEKHLPELYRGLEHIEEAIGTEEYEETLQREFAGFVPESIDYGVMEKAENIYIIPGIFGWDDVGSWLAVGRINPPNELGNVINGNIITVNTRDSIIQGTDKLIAAVGVSNLIVVDTEDALLICAKESANDIKKVIENLKICNRTEYI